MGGQEYGVSRPCLDHRRSGEPGFRHAREGALSGGTSLFSLETHLCWKRTAIARKIYHYPRHVAAQADEAAIVHHRLRRARAATSARSIPLPPVRLVGTGRVSAPAQNETVDSSGSVLPPTPGIQPTSPYGALVPVSPAE